MLKQRFALYFFLWKSLTSCYFVVSEFAAVHPPEFPSYLYRKKNTSVLKGGIVHYGAPDFDLVTSGRIIRFANAINFCDKSSKCDQLTQSFYAQTLGAKAVMFLTNTSCNAVQDLGNPTVEQQDFSIPLSRLKSVVIPFCSEDSKLLRDILPVYDASDMESKKFSGDIKWNIPKVAGPSYLQFWLDLAYPESVDTMQQLSHWGKRLVGLLQFTPQFPIYLRKPDSNNSKSDCWRNSSLCAHSSGKDASINGSVVVSEYARQLCLLKLTSVKSVRNTKARVTGNMYWKYIELLFTHCSLCGNHRNSLAQNCSYLILNRLLGSEAKAVKDCENSNYILDEMSALIRHRPKLSSSLVNSKFMVPGIINGDQLIKAVCSSFIRMPEQCRLILLEVRRHSIQQLISFWKLFAFVVAGITITVAISILIHLFSKKRVSFTSLIREEIFLRKNWSMTDKTLMDHAV